MTKKLYPSIEPNQSFHLPVGDTHEIYVETCGNPAGVPVVFVHGGPGAGCGLDDRCFFDAEKYHIVLFDQRGCNRSKPLGNIEENTTQHLVQDIETIREHLNINQWVVFGGSWGSTLSLVYSQTHRDRVLGLIVRGVFFGTPEENRWLWQEGLSRFNPEAYDRYQSLVPEDQRDHILEVYYQMMIGGDVKQRNLAAAEMMLWEEAGYTMQNYQPTLDLENWHQGVLEAHYCVHNCFIEDRPIAENLAVLQGMPVYIVNGRYDLLCPPIKAYQLHKALPGSRLTVVDRAGHASKEPGMVDALVSATDEMLLKLQLTG
ncbi:prolyl aminopeptidase [Marinicella litoralis]|uniref:Proline iminopeptidase n=1 Tax=Marinicella litoralis TaxID=644220 RepID=A0A4R6XU37_9GAMM|nr:prolyl aminopeptidase [Marinicella litoralis]TDR23492.1 prolyl aminopeptidase [Marinicella litoralis]